MNDATESTPGTAHGPSAIQNDQSGAMVFVGAHADDIELHAGGWAAQAAQEGRVIHYVMVSNNMSGELQPTDDSHDRPYFLGPGQTREIRHREQKAAAALIGAKIHFLDYPQRHYWDGRQRALLTFAPHVHDTMPASSGKPPLILAGQDTQAIREMGQLLVDLKPAVIVTQTITDVDPEHHATASLVWQAYRQQARALRGVPLLFWAPGTSSLGGMLPSHYDHYVCLTQAQFDIKMKMLNCHASQMTRRRLDMAEQRARYWGWEMDKPYAEVFTTIFNGLERNH